MSIADFPLGGSTNSGIRLDNSVLNHLSQALPALYPLRKGMSQDDGHSVFRLQTWRQKREIWRGK